MADDEKAMVEEVFGNAIAPLSEDDKHLPQVRCLRLMFEQS